MYAIRSYYANQVSQIEDLVTQGIDVLVVLPADYTALGSALKTADVENASYVTVLAYNTAEELFGKADVVGEQLTIGGRNFLVVGVLEEDTSSYNFV